MSDPRTVSLIAIAANDIPVEFPPAALGRPSAPAAAPLGHRLDLRDMPLVTIDGEDARDFDDAVFAEPDPDRIPAAGACWSPSPTSPGTCATTSRSTAPPTSAATRSISPTASCRCCRRRCPTAGARCARSEDRPVLVVEMWIDAEGQLKRHRFQRALMRSAARLTYEQVQARAWTARPTTRSRR